MNIPKSDLPRIILIGGGFGGINLIKNLKNASFQVILMDKRNYHTFQPTIGRNNAVTDIWKMHFGGFIDWALWTSVHLVFLVMNL